MLQQLEADLGFQAQYELMFWARIIAMAETGEERVLVRHSMTPQRESFLNEILVGYKTRVVSYIKRNEDYDVTTFEDLKLFLVGARNLAFYSFEFNDGELNRVLVDRDEQALRMLMAGRVDFVVTYDVGESKEIALNNGIDFEKEFTLASYQEVFFNGRFLSIPLGTKLNADWYDPINCAVLGYRMSGQIDAWFQEENVTPYFQKFDEPQSLAQEKSCKEYQAAIK
jgi:polar amino acid transport system substrate-binding protein